MRRGLLMFIAPVLALSLFGAGCKKTASSNVDVIQAMKVAMVGVHSASFEISGLGTSPAGTVPGADGFEFRLTGNARRPDTQLANVSGTFSIKTTGEQPMEAAGEYRLVNTVSYGRMTTVPTIPGMDLTRFQDQWFSFPTSPTRMMEKAEAGKELTKDQIKQLEKLFSDTEFFSSVEVGGSEEIHGQATTSYTVMLDEAAVLKMMEESGRITGEPVTDADREQARQGVKSWNANPGMLWIGDRDSYLYRVKGSMENGTVQVDLFDFDKSKASVEAPAGAKDFGEALGAMMGFDLSAGATLPGASANAGGAMDFGSIPGMTPEMLKMMNNL